MRAYEEYKDSGVEWIGSIPKEWKVSKIKYVTRNFDGKRIPLSGLERSDMNGTFPYYGANGIIDYIDDFIFNGDYILVGEDGAPFRDKFKNVAYRASGKFWVNNHAHILSTQNSINRDYIFFFLNKVDYNYYIMGSTRDKLTQQQLSNIPISIPPNNVQKSIANYLNDKTKKIDTILNRKQNLISLLEEKKQAIINQAVTKGLDDNVEMKESGIDWLKKIPKHWRILRLAAIGIFSKGKGISRSDLTKNGYPSVLYGDIYTKYNIKTKKFTNFISQETAKNSESIKNGSILFTGSGETVEEIGKTIVYTGLEEAFVGGDIIIFEQKSQNSEFLSYSLNSSFSQFQKSLTAKGEIIVHTYASQLRNIKIFIPPNKEQVEIVNYLDTELSKIEKSIKKIKIQIELLKEYKESLIYESVTGKIKVADKVR